MSGRHAGPLPPSHSSTRAVVAAALFLGALAAGLAGWDTPHVTGATFLALVLALAALDVVAPLISDGPAVERVTLEEAVRRQEDAR